MTELYYGKGTCAMGVHIALAEAGMPYKLHSVDLLKGEQKTPAYLKVNPKGYVPALKTEIGTLTEAQVILQYIAEKNPDKNLFPKLGTSERYSALEWLNFVSTEMHKGIGAYFALKMYENPQTQEDLKKSFANKMKSRYEFLNERLMQNTFVLGNTFSIVDAYLIPVLGWTKFFKIDLTPYPAIMGYMEKMATRPSVQTAMREEGLG